MTNMQSSTKEDRIKALIEQIERDQKAGILVKKRLNDANNHVHSTYSFSPYSPSEIAYQAYRSGLNIVGIVDHDTLQGASEFKTACGLLGIASTTGVEVRVRCQAFPTYINHPDQPSTMYMVAHAVPDANIQSFDDALRPYRLAREARNRKMVEKINHHLAFSNLTLDYDRDIRTLSMAHDGGTVTERHLLFGLARALIRQYPDPDQLIEVLETRFGRSISDKQRAFITFPEGRQPDYDLLGILKMDTNFFYIPAEDELMDVSAFIKLAKVHQAIVAYAYLGDVTESVTNDKKMKQFEDGFLDQLIVHLKHIGVEAVAYMPTRNTKAQIRKVQALCRSHRLLEISGEDINAPEQSFTCVAYQQQEYHHLIDSAWALVGHEQAIDQGRGQGVSADLASGMTLAETIQKYASIGRK
ncbi:MAG: PHP domain-containing protein [Acholeplasmataceae bacterium]|nr:PHP domain-containing protein [Acholeplasmataceae bacterium]